MRLARSCAIVIASGVGALCISSAASAAPSARLVYVRDVGAEECPEEAAVRAAVSARLGYDPFFPYAPATLFAEVARKDGVFTARVKLVDEQNVVRGDRALKHAGPRCTDLIDTMALTMSIAIILLRDTMGRTPRPLHEKLTTRVSSHPSHRSRARPRHKSFGTVKGSPCLFDVCFEVLRTSAKPTQHRSRGGSQ